MSKDEKLISISEKLDVEILKLQACQQVSPLVSVATQHIAQLKQACLNDNVVSAALAALSLDDLKRLQASMASSNSEEVRIRAVSAVLFKADVEPLKALKCALECCKDGMEAATTAAIYKEFLSEHGRVEWARLTKTISDTCLQKAFEAGQGAGR